MRDALVSSLQFSQARDAELAWVDGQLIMSSAESHFGVMEEGEVAEDEEKMDVDQKNREEAMDMVPILEQLPPHEVMRAKQYRTTWFYLYTLS